MGRPSNTDPAALAAAAILADAQVAPFIKSQMEARGLSLGDITDRTQLSKSTLHRKLSGLGSFNVVELNLIAGALQVPVSQLVDVA